MEINQITEKQAGLHGPSSPRRPQEDMIERYLEDGDLFVLSENGDILTVMCCAG